MKILKLLIINSGLLFCLLSHAQTSTNISAINKSSDKITTSIEQYEDTASKPLRVGSPAPKAAQELDQKDSSNAIIKGVLYTDDEYFTDDIRIKDIKSELYNLGFYDGDINNTQNDEYRIALILFQRENGLPEGEPSIETLSALGLE